MIFRNECQRKKDFMIIIGSNLTVGSFDHYICIFVTCFVCAHAYLHTVPVVEYEQMQI